MYASSRGSVFLNCFTLRYFPSYTWYTTPKYWDTAPYPRESMIQFGLRMPTGEGEMVHLCVPSSFQSIR